MLTAGSQECPGLRGHPALRTRSRSPTPLHRPSHKPRHSPGTCPGHRSVGPAVSSASRRTCPGRRRRTPDTLPGYVLGTRGTSPANAVRSRREPGRAGVRAGREVVAGRLLAPRVCVGQDTGAACTGAPPFSRQTSTVLTTNKYRFHGKQVPFSRRTSTVLTTNKYRSRGRERGGRGGRAHRAREVLGRRRPVGSR